MKQLSATSDEFMKLERALIDANYLGLALREFGRNENFACAEATGFVADLLIGWARLIGERMREGDKMFFQTTDARASMLAPRRQRSGVLSSTR